MGEEVAKLFGEWLGLAGLVAATIICYGGYLYITSTGDADRMLAGKKLIYGAVVGLVVVIGAGAIGGVATGLARSTNESVTVQEVSESKAVEFECKGNLVESSVCGLVRQLVTSGVGLVDKALDGVLASTTLPGDNPGLVRMWNQMLLVGYGLVILIVGIVGFGIMGGEVFGLGDFSFGELVKRLGLGILGANVSLYILSIPIRLANVITGEVLGPNGTGLLASFFKARSFGSLDGSLFLAVLALVAVVMGVVLLVFYAIRHMVIALIVVVAPLIVILAIVPRMSTALWEIGRIYVGLVCVTVVHAILIRLAVVLVTVSNLPVFLNYFAALALMYLLVKTPVMTMELFGTQSGLEVAHKGQEMVRQAAVLMAQLKLPVWKKEATVKRGRKKK